MRRIKALVALASFFAMTAVTAQSPAFDLERGTVTLNSGYEMPILGIGTYTLSSAQAENSVYWALRAGMRLIDTARIYGNEEGVGRGIQRAIKDGICTRGEIFVTTKMWTSDFSDGDAAVDASLKRLGLDYIDLMILHHSQASNDVAAYKAMDRAVKAGKLRSIGLSNYYEPGDFDRLVKATSIKPALLQNETHPYHQSGTMKAHIAQYGTVMESWYPLGGRGHTKQLFDDPTISKIAKAYGKSAAQVILRWQIQAGNIAIPGSSNEKHIIEDHAIWDFSLTDEEMKKIADLVKAQSPNIIILGGDYVSGHKYDKNLIENMAMKIMAIGVPVYAVLGESDWESNGKDISRMLKINGIQLLENDFKRIIIKNRYVNIVGIADLKTRQPNLSRAIPRSQYQKIIITHNPDIYYDIMESSSIFFASQCSPP